MKNKAILLLVVLVAVACSRSYEVFSNKYPVSFSCDISQSPFNTMQTPSHYLTIRPTPAQNGYKVRDLYGHEHTFPYTEVQSRIFRYGLGGLIIGKPYFGDGEYYAYDLACPQCDRASYTLTISSHDMGIATCPRCATSYDLNNGGVPKTGNSRPLYRYRTSLNGTMLMVHN